MTKQVWVLYDKRLLAAELVKQGKTTSLVTIPGYPCPATTTARVRNDRIVDHDALFAVYYNTRGKYWISQDIATNNRPGSYWVRNWHMFVYTP